MSGFATLILSSSNVATATIVIAKPVSKPVSIEDKIVYYSDKYDVSAEIISNVISCESTMNPKAINSSRKEFSVGLSQINLMAHKNITVNQAMDPDFSIEFMAKNIKRNPQWWTCHTKLYGV